MLKPVHEDENDGYEDEVSDSLDLKVNVRKVQDL
jgi:hypothetical protein